jgi:hypothetical protein
MTEQPKNKFQQSGRVKVIKGSILFPHDAGLRFILNVTNTAGKMESPMYPLFDKKWPNIKKEARGWYANKTGAYKVGAVASVAVQSDVWAINLLCQNDDLQTDLVGLEKCLKETCKMAKYERASVHCSNLLTEAIPELQDLITTNLVEQGVAVCYYEEPTV